MSFHFAVIEAVGPASQQPGSVLKLNILKVMRRLFPGDACPGVRLKWMRVR